MDNILSRTHFEIGPFLSLFDSNGNLSFNVNPPKFIIYNNIKKDIKPDSRKISFKISGLDPRLYLSTFWIHIPLPNQKTNDLIKKIFYSNHASGLDILRKIKINHNNRLKKVISKQEYEFELKTLMKYDYLKKRYFDPIQNSNYKNRLENKLNQEIDEDIIHIPIFFNSNSYTANSSSIEIEISLHQISKLYSFTKNFPLNDIDFKNIKATGVFYALNDYQFFEFKETALYEKESMYEYFNLENKSEFTLNNELIGNHAIFLINDESFKPSEYFYGKNIKESVTCFLNSSFKAVNDTDTCLDLATRKFKTPSLRSLFNCEKIDDYRIKLIYKNNESEYETIIKSTNVKFEEIPVYLDVSISEVLNLFWFEYIEIDICKYDSIKHKLDNTKVKNNAIKIIDGLFRISDKNNELISVLGVIDYRFNYKVKMNNDLTNCLQCNEIKYLNQKHYDVYFSLPIFNRKHSYFSECDFVSLDFSDWRWMDLDRKYEWKYSKIKISDLNDTNFKLEFDNNALTASSYGDMDYTFISFVPSGNGYFLLKNLKIYLEHSDYEFYQIKKRYNLTNKLFISNLKFFNRTNHNNLDLNSLVKLTNHESCLSILEANGFKKMDADFITNS